MEKNASFRFIRALIIKFSQLKVENLLQRFWFGFLMESAEKKVEFSFSYNQNKRVSTSLSPFYPHPSISNHYRIQMKL